MTDLKEHYADVLPVLAEHRIQGLFFLITGCLEDHVVAPVHMNHILMAAMDWEQYTKEFEEQLFIADRHAAESERRRFGCGTHLSVGHARKWHGSSTASISL